MSFCQRIGLSVVLLTILLPLGNLGHWKALKEALEEKSKSAPTGVGAEKDRGEG